VSLPRYPKYKDSGVEWLGQVPEHWGVMPIRRAAKLESGHTPSRNHPEYWEDCIVPWFTLADVWQIREERRSVILETKEKVSELGLMNSSARRLPAGTVMLSRTASVGFAAIMGVEMATTQDFANWVCGDRLKPEYLLNVFRAMRGEFSRRMMGSTHNTIYMPDIQALEFALPSLPEQIAITAFLDFEIAKLDALVAEQERLIELLKEKRQAVISHAVTKGLNPEAPMKDSGVEWLGEIPAHWNVSPLKWLTDPERPIMYGIVLPGPDVGDGGIPILKGGNVKPSRMNLASMARTTPELEAPYARARIKSGDLVYSIRGTIGDCEFVPAELDGSNITQDVARVAVSYGISASWVRWALLAPPVRADLACGSLGAAVRGINIFDLKRATIPMPPPIEQAKIAAFLDTETDRLDSLTAEAERAIALLEERRAALITAAVTGQIDVRYATKGQEQ
jgi:type I restriction enzyme S subunit